MSSRSVALLARAAMFALEALEPRRFLSGDVQPLDLNLQKEHWISVYDLQPASTFRYSFQAKAGAHYSFYSATDDLQRLDLVDPSDHSIISASIGDPEVLELLWVAPRNGAFELDLELASTSDHLWLNEHAFGDPSNAVELGDEAVIEAPSVDGPEVWFKFEGRANENYRFTASGGGTQGGMPQLLLIGPDRHSEIAFSDYDLLAALPQDGTYYLKVFGNVESGVFPTSIAKQFIPDDYGNSPSTATAIAIGQAVHGSIDDEIDHDLFSFPAEVGRQYVFNTNGSVWVSVVDAAGQALTSDSRYVGALEDDLNLRRIWVRTEWTAPASGYFYLDLFPGCMMMACVRNVNYALTAAEVTDIPLGSPTSAIPLQDNLTSGTLAQASDNWFKFEAPALRHYAFSTAGSLRAAILEVTDEKGNVLATNDVVEIWPYLMPTLQWQAPQAGTYYLHVRSFSAAVSGDYRIHSVFMDDDHGDTSQTAQALPVGESIPGTILNQDVPWMNQRVKLWDNQLHDADVFQTAVDAGRTYMFSARDSSGRSLTGNWWLRAYRFIGEGWEDARGTQKWWPDGRLEITPVSSGVIFIQMNSTERQLKYRIQSAIVNEVGASAATEFQPGSSISVSITQPGEAQWLRFEARAYRDYRFIATSGELADLALSVVNGNGQVVRDRYGDDVYESDHGTLDFRPQQNGVYYLRIESWNGQGTGTVTLTGTVDGHSMDDSTHSDEKPSPTPATKELLARREGLLKEGEVDVVSFHAVAGGSYTFQTVLGTLHDSILGLFDPITQTVIAVNDDTDDESLWDDDVQSLSSQVEWTADRSGDVYLLVYGLDENSTGTYRLEIYSTGAALTEETLKALSLPAARSIEIAGAVDDALYANEEQASDYSDVWDDSQDSWNDSSLLEEDAWDDQEDREDI